MKRNILIVDDEESIREICKELLEEEGYLVNTASNGFEALEMINLNIYDLYLLDLSMPKMDGFELMTNIKKIQPLAVIIILTGHSSIDGAVRAVQTGAYKYISKPIDADDFINSVNAGIKHSDNLYGPIQRTFYPGHDNTVKGEPIILHGFTAEEKKEFFELGIPKKFQTSEEIPIGKDHTGSIIIIESGSISVWLNKNMVDYLHKWDTVGDESFIISDSSFVSLRAESNTKVLYFNRKKILDFLAYKGDKLFKRFIINLLNSSHFRWRKSAQRIVMLNLVSKD